MAVLPVGTLTFLLTDIEGSTRTWETRTRAMRDAMALHDSIVYASVERHAGVMVESGRAGDSIFAVFRAAKNGALCALDIQRGFRTAAWPENLSLRIRVALHTGEVELRAGHYFGPPLNRCARVLALCHGRQTLVTQATRELLVEDPPSEVELTDLGMHRLKDLHRSERIYQMTDLTRPERFPPLHARPEYKSNLPIPLTSFVGRQRELAELRGLLRESRLLTLTGPGGAGKSRLARQLTIEVADEMPGGVWLVELAPVSDPRLVARTIATALDVEEQQGRPLIETLADRCGGPAMLLTLDNCEHLVGACAEVIEALLASCAQLRTVTTSREPLNIGGELTWRVPALDESEAVRLFADRERSRSPRSEPSDEHMRVVGEICRRLDGIPLAIELAAARASTLPLDEIRRRLDSGPAFLAGGSRTAARRQQTLEATIDWSFDLLSDAERTLFRRLAVFAGRFSLDAAETVCAREDLPRDTILELIVHLVSKSLLQTVDDRYAYLSTIRAYANAKLVASGEVDALRRAHTAYFLRIAESRPPGALADWLDRIEEEHDDVREALRWTIDADPQTGARMSAALYEFWLLRGYALEARSFLERLAAVLPATTVRLRVLLDTGVFAYTSGAFDVATRLMQEGVTGARTFDDRELLARALVFHGVVALAAGRVDVAQSAFDEGLAIAQETGNERRQAEALHHLGALASVRGDLSLALRRYSESLDMRRRLGIADEAGPTLAFRALVLTLRSDLPGARADIVEALRIGLALRDRRAAWSLDAQACLAALGGDVERALRLAGAAQAAFEATAQHPPALWRRFTEPVMERARTTLGAEAATAAMAAGRALTFEQALQYALETRTDAHAVPGGVDEAR